MLAPPLYCVDAARGFATVYTAVYRPLDGAVDYLWPGHRWPQHVHRFESGTYTHDYHLAAEAARGPVVPSPPSR